MMDTADGSTESSGRLFKIVLFARQKRGLIHPDYRSSEGISRCWQIIGMHNHIATTDVYFIFKRKRDCHGGISLLKLFIIGHDGFDPAFFSGWQGYYFITFTYDAGGDGSAITPEIQIGAIHILHREPEVIEIPVSGNFDVFQQPHQGSSLIPGRVFTGINHVVTVQCGNRDEVKLTGIQFFSKVDIVLFDVIEDCFAEIHQIHFIHSNNDVFNAE